MYEMRTVFFSALADRTVVTQISPETNGSSQQRRASLFFAVPNGPARHVETLVLTEIDVSSLQAAHQGQNAREFQSLVLTFPISYIGTS